MSAEQDVKEILKRLSEAVDRAYNRRALRFLGEAMADMIRDRTRSGYGVEKQFGNRKPLKDLSGGYIHRRKRMRLSPFTTPSKSNLTQTGKMLSDLRPRNIKDGRVKQMTIGFSKQFSRDKADWAVDGGRPFNNLGRAEVTEMFKIQKKSMDRAFRASRL